MAILLLVRLAMLGDNTIHIDFNIRGPWSSKPIALDESRALIIVDTLRKPIRDIVFCVRIF